MKHDETCQVPSFDSCFEGTSSEISRWVVHLGLLRQDLRKYTTPLLKQIGVRPKRAQKSMGQ